MARRREARLTSWAPTDATAAPLVELVRGAEAKALGALSGLRRDDVADVALALAGFETMLARWLSNSRIEETVRRVGSAARLQAERHWRAEVRRAAKQDLALDTRPSRELVQRWIAENTARIQGLRAETLRQIRADLETAALSETRPQELAAQWERQGLPTTNGTLRGRATVIARHQLGMLASQIAEAHGRGLGLTGYMWDDAPSRPRKQDPIHRGRRGAHYEWDGPPPGGHAGRRVGCQCRAVAVVSLDRLEEFAAETIFEPVGAP